MTLAPGQQIPDFGLDCSQITILIGDNFVAARGNISGLWVLDERESALVFSECLTHMAMLREPILDGSQSVLSTLFPILAALAKAQLYEISPWGPRKSSYAELELI